MVVSKQIEYDESTSSVQKIIKVHAKSLYYQMIQGGLPYEQFPFLDLIDVNRTRIEENANIDNWDEMRDSLMSRTKCTMCLLQTIFVNAKIHVDLSKKYNTVRNFLANGNGYALLQMDREGEPVNILRSLIDLLIADELVRSPVKDLFPLLFDKETLEAHAQFASLATLLLYSYLRLRNPLWKTTSYNKSHIKMTPLLGRQLCRIRSDIVSPFVTRIVDILTMYFDAISITNV